MYRECRITEEISAEILPRRKADSNKGTFGTLQLFCGSALMTGAPYLAATGALRCGTGLVVVSTEAQVLNILQTRLTEPVFYPVRIHPRANAFVCGCGLGTNAEITADVIRTGLPAVIDADSLNYISRNREVTEAFHSRLVLTPHPAEFSRLTGMSVEDIQKDRTEAAGNYAVRHGVVLVLKGHETIVAAPDGQVYINTTGNSGLAKGGSGDVLAGMIGAFLAQGVSAEKAAVLGVWLHGKAADCLAEKTSQYGLLPSEIPEESAKILGRLERSK